MQSRTRRLAKLGWFSIVAIASLALLADLADARSGGGRSVGSRGTNTYSAPPTTNTAPKTAAPVERSMAQKSTTAQNQLPAPATQPPASAAGRACCWAA